MAVSLRIADQGSKARQASPHWLRCVRICVTAVLLPLLICSVTHLSFRSAAGQRSVESTTHHAGGSFTPQQQQQQGTDKGPAQFSGAASTPPADTAAALTALPSLSRPPDVTDLPGTQLALQEGIHIKLKEASQATSTLPPPPLNVLPSMVKHEATSEPVPVRVPQPINVGVRVGRVKDVPDPYLHVPLGGHTS